MSLKRQTGKNAQMTIAIETAQFYYSPIASVNLAGRQNGSQTESDHAPLLGAIRQGKVQADLTEGASE